MKLRGGGRRSAWLASLFLAMVVAGSGAAPARGQQLEHAACRYISKTDAARILGVAAGEIMLAGGGKALPAMCSVTVVDNPLKRISFSVYRLDSVRQAERELLQMKNGFAVLSLIDAIPDLGEEAFYAQDKRVRRLVVRQGSWLIDIMPQREMQHQIDLGRIVLQNLP